MFRIGVDSGGTFTDFVMLDGSAVHVAKVPSNRRRPEIPVESGLTELAQQVNTSLDGLLTECEFIIYGTTVATNALIQQKGATTALLCTDGFRDSFEIRQGYKEERFAFDLAPPPVLVPRERRIPILERIDKDGSVYRPLDEDDTRAKLRALRDSDLEGIAVCFLFSYLAPEHEQTVARLVAEELPDVFCTLSSEVMPRIREYDRTSTTILNAYLGPSLQRHLDRVEAMLVGHGFEKPFRVLQANAGCASLEVTRKFPLHALNSGPAAAPVAANASARHLGHTNLISIDMGGTSFDVCLVLDGVPDVVTTSDVCRYRVGVPMVGVHTVGAGGGSIAWVEDGLLQVGPHSAEAMPGPACYGSGGVEPTVTDADLVLGFLNPAGLLGGRLPLDREAAHRAISKGVAQPLGMTVEQAAAGIYEVVNHKMTSGTAEITIDRGHDPRDFAMVVGGGAGAMHAAAIARELGVRTVVIPRVASVYCAFGAAVGDLRHDSTGSYGAPTALSDLDLGRLEQLLVGMEDRGRAALAVDGEPAANRSIRVSRWFEMRYRRQVHDCIVPMTVEPGELHHAGVLDSIERAFHDRHEALYAYADRDNGVVELVNIGVSVRRTLAEFAMPQRERRADTPENAPIGTRDAYLSPGGGFVPAPVFSGERLRLGDVVFGPAIIEETTTTIVVPTGTDVRLESGDVYVMEIR